MTQNSFAQTLKSLKLSRDENHFFTTGNAEIDHALSLDNQTLYGNPESDVQQNFAAIVYLNGLFENTCTHFTAIPFGFLYEIDHEGTKSCYVSVEAESKPTSGSFIKFALDNLSEQIDTYKQTKNLSKEEIEFCDYVLYQIKNSKNLPLTAIVQNISAALNNSTTLNKFKQNSNQSKQIFNQTNQSNCNENRYTLNLIIENRDEVCRELLGFELIKLQSYIDALGIKLGFDLAELQEPLYVKFDDFGNKTQEQRNADEKSQTAAYITKMQEKFESLQNSINTVVSLQPEDKAQLEKTIERIKSLQLGNMNQNSLMSWIISGYLSHKGFDRQGNSIEQNRNIINERGSFESYVEKIYGAKTKQILNSCATDYIADRVYDIISLYDTNTSYSHEQSNFESQMQACSKTDAQNRYHKNKARRAISSRVGYGSLIEKQ